MRNNGVYSSDSLSGWLSELSARHPVGIDLGLERTETVRRALGLVLPMPVAVVGGTNGKGSVCAMLDAMLRGGGARTGRYMSPHVSRFNERICVDGAEADDNTLLSAFARVEAARAGARVSLTYFEFITLAAAQVFAEAGADAVVLEVGLGGRLDAVNVFPAQAAAVTNIGLDHREFLGGTAGEIAREKAGIFHTGCPAVVGDAAAPPELFAEAEKRGAKLYAAGRDFSAARGENGWHYRGRRSLYNLPVPAMRGAHQIANAACAIAILENLPEHLWPGAGAVRRGLHAAAAPGRGQVLPGVPAAVLDVAHNTEAAAALERMLFDMGYYPRTAAVFGMMARKDAFSFVRALRRRVDVWYAVCPRGGDISAASLAAAAERAGARAEECVSMKEAAARARDYCGKSGRIVVTGSFTTVADYIQQISDE
ncbi:MAG: bifunctional folylpolyglutamate synthase/dihydrofolate synthase [Betaproteobacteria bacterium]|nr:bifunctional folylpolyglutamate synthase/dihydrofolate synthase [Betaproteobacteria bacterium]